MKILDRYLLKTFLITFTSVFVILFFIFILQTVWLFISELAGKDLDIVLIFKFLMFASPKLIPLVLPLSVLLSSIMTFGDLAENYEFAAMKSAGISFQRAVSGLIIFIFILAMAAFFFANNIIPYAEYKFTNFRRNLAQVKPAMAIAEGQFSNIGEINIKVNKKSGDRGQFLEGVTMHKKSTLGEGAKTVIKSKTGRLIGNENSNLLQLVLKDGYYYEDIVPQNYQDREKLPFAKAYFKEYIINIDLSKLNNIDLDKDVSSNSDNMLNVKELKYAVDSLSTNYKKEITTIADNIYNRTGITNTFLLNSQKLKNAKTPDLISFLNESDQFRVLEIATSDAVSSTQNIEINNSDLGNKKKSINSFWIAINEKFVIMYASIMMFFIGAPLGSIIKKGGLGLPIVFAMLIFITYHFLNTFGKKLAEESGTTPFIGTWVSSMVLTPLAIFLVRKAVNDGGSINFDAITEPFQKVFKKIIKRNKSE
jgi:lipopolysaccharide export system permease protein